MIDKAPLLDAFNYYVSLLTLIGLIILVVLSLLLAYSYFSKKEFEVLFKIREYALPLGFFASLIGTIASLFYSDYLGYIPCGLCWLQRIFLYPQVILFGIAWWKKDLGVFVYSLCLSIIGFAIGVYHNYLQLGYNPLVPCPLTGMYADCAVPPFVEFGFITFPLMAMVIFGFLIFLACVRVRGNAH